MKILFVADPLNTFKIYKDTTFSMMREAQARGHQIYACEPQQISWERGAMVRADTVAPVMDDGVKSELASLPKNCCSQDSY